MEIDSLRTGRSQVTCDLPSYTWPADGWLFYPGVSVALALTRGMVGQDNLVIRYSLLEIVRSSAEWWSAPEVARVYDYCS